MPRVRLPRSTHRARLAYLAALCCTLISAPGVAAPAQPDSVPRIAAANWTVAETLIAIGVAPYAVADIPNYNDWVKAPPIPPETIDLGLRNQPNLELLAQNPPDLLLTSGLFSRDNVRLKRLMPVRVLDNFYTGQHFYPATLEMTREVGRLTHHEAQAEALIQRTERVIADTAEALANVERPVYIVQFSDAQHVRVFGQGNMIGTLFARTPLENAWTGPTNAWGYANISIDRLAETPNASIIVIKPFPRAVADELADNRIWQHLPAVREGRVSQIEPVWSFGGLESMQRLAQALVQALAPTDRRGGA